jgi:hypothetical protein
MRQHQHCADCDFWCEPENDQPAKPSQEVFHEEEQREDDEPQSERRQRYRQQASLLGAGNDEQPNERE